MLTVGLTGGYASGKTVVAAELERLGCQVIYADKLGHQVLQPSGEAYSRTVAEFGPGILDAQRRIDRKKLGALVFANPEKLARLSSFVHPAVFRVEEQIKSEFARTHPRGILITEAAILIETGRYQIFNRIVVTVCDEEAQVTRGAARDSLSPQEARARLGAQMPLSEKRAFAHYMIDTGGSIADTQRQVEELYRDLVRDEALVSA